jgi:hypothetical protein
MAVGHLKEKRNPEFFINYIHTLANGRRATREEKREIVHENNA